MPTFFSVMEKRRTLTSRAGLRGGLGEVDDADSDREEADQEAEGRLGQARLQECSEIATDEAADTAGDAHWPVRGDGAGCGQREQAIGRSATIEVMKVAASAAGATAATAMPVPTRMGPMIDPPPMP